MAAVISIMNNGPVGAVMDPRIMIHGTVEIWETAHGRADKATTEEVEWVSPDHGAVSREIVTEEAMGIGILHQGITEVVLHQEE